jgi:hypothetical protein
MDSIRTLTVNTAHEALTRALWPSIVLSVAVALDQCTRGPSITAMLITAYLNGQLTLG